MRARERSPVLGRAASAGVLLALVLASTSVFGEDPVEPPAPAAAPSGTEGPAPAPPGEPTKDIFDVIREWRGKPPPPPPNYKKRMTALAPVISYSPTSGAGLGVAGNLAFFKGHPKTTRISSVVASVIATTEKQLLASARIDASSGDNTWNLQGDNRFYWTSQKTYGLGTATTPEDAVDQKFNQFRIYETLYREIRHDVYLGAGLLYNLHTNVRPDGEDAEAAWPDSPYIEYSERNGFDLDSQASAGASLQALVDTRDSAINPSRGWYGEASYLMFFDGFLGGTSSWQQFSYDLRTYVRLGGDRRHKLAFWAFGDLVTGGVAPYLDLPGTGLDTYSRSGRGYPQGRFRGERMLYGEVEYRWTITGNGLFGMVFFANAETLSNEQSGEKLFDSVAPAAGFGFRLMLNKRSQTNLCLDIGFGQEGSRGVYFAVQEAF
jgi:hypothetical protein